MTRHHEATSCRKPASANTSIEAMVETPSVSLIIPTYERPTRLAACLHAVAQLDYPTDRLQVIVVDDGSASPPSEVVASFQSRLDITLICKPHAGPAAARNAGAAQARGEFLAFTDDDCAPRPDWLRVLVDQLTATPNCGVGGQTLNALGDNPYATASQLLITYLYKYYNAIPHQARLLTSNNLAVPARLFREIGGFDEHFGQAAGEDREFCDRWTHRGYRLIYVPEAVVEHAHAMSWRGFWRQHHNYGRAAFAFHVAHASRSGERVRMEPWRFYAELLSFPIQEMGLGRGWRLALLMGVTQIANGLGFYWARLRAARKGEAKPCRP